MDDQESSDYHNFSQASSPAHRLPTLNGVQALFDAVEKHKPISTGIAGLDATLCLTDDVLPAGGGIPRGRLTEIYGAPGSGKTHFAIQLAANALCDGDDAQVVWIDTSSQLPYSRLRRFLQPPQKTPVGDAPATNGVDGDEEATPDERLEYVYISSFPHLLALLLHPSQDFPPASTSLLVIDGLSNVTLMGLPQNDTISNRLPTTNGSLTREDIISKSIATRRAAMLAAISSGLARLAASRNIAVVAINNTSSHRRPGGKTSVLRSALNVQQWNENVSTRIVIYRDFWPVTDWKSLDREEARKQRKREKWPLRIAEVEKLNGNEVSAEGTKFVILRNRLQAVEPPKSVSITITGAEASSSPQLPSQDNEEAMGDLGLEDAEEVEDESMRMPEDIASSPAAQELKATKRKIDEVVDSEDEDEIEIGTAARLPAVPRGQRGFLPSSQLAQEGAEDGGSPVSARQAAGVEDHAIDGQDDDMLLQN